jgi:hypothetical protein
LTCRAKSFYSRESRKSQSSTAKLFRLLA